MSARIPTNSSEAIPASGAREQDIQIVPTQSPSQDPVQDSAQSAVQYVALPATPPDKKIEAGEQDDTLKEAWHEVVSGSPGWLMSLAIHMLLVIVLALWYLPELPQISRNLLLSDPSSAEDTLEDFQEIEIDAVQLETEPVEFEVQPDTDVLAEEVSLSTFQDATAAPMFTELSDLGLTAASPTSQTNVLGFNGVGTTGRGSMSRTAITKAGGNSESEEAIAAALKWLAEHQNQDGTWSLNHTRGRCNGRCPNPAGGEPASTLRAATGLALLPFLGAGQTHLDGKHRRVVARGLDALIRLRKKEDAGASWRDPNGTGAYTHGITAIVLTEAYGMTHDSAVGGYAQAAVDYIVACQGSDGGWRYMPRQVPGDTSVVGWQVMALKSAHLAELRVPPQTVAGATKFLDSVAYAEGSEYAYVPNPPQGQGPSKTRSSIGLLCRMYMGWKKDNESLQRGAIKIARAGPSQSNFYYNYYASQVLFQYTGGKGSMWRDWNSRMRDQLIAQQERAGHLKGSWFVDGDHNDSGGRIYMTSLATMTLEVYYRYMPIYQTDAVERDFPQ